MLKTPLQILQEAGFHLLLREYIYHLGGGTKDAALQLKVPNHQIIKTVIFTDGHGASQQYVAAIMHGDYKISVRKLERLCHLSFLRPASPEEVARLTGSVVGGISPFLLPRNVPICVQESIRVLPVIVVNAGQRGLVFITSPTCFDLFSVTFGDMLGAQLHSL